VKVGVLWLSEYLRAELGPLGIRVSCICPLLVRTRMGDAGQAGATRQPEWLFHPPEHIARLICRTIGSRRFLVYGSQVLHALHLLYRFAPGSRGPCSRQRPAASCARVRRLPRASWRGARLKDDSDRYFWQCGQ
jgi:short-subunit dehydrogenase